MTPYLERLERRTAAVGSCLCLGLDPDPAALPAGFAPDAGGVEAFARLVLEAALPHAAAVKANLAFFEAFGSSGVAALERLRARIPAEVPFIADAKRGDIGTTAARQAVALFDSLGADAVTANPYLGQDALVPLLERGDRFVYVLCRTSNAGAGVLQDLPVTAGQDDPDGGNVGRPLYLHVARTAAGWARDRPNIGLVVGATAPAELALVREAAPELAFLVPGIGAQGGDVGAVMAHGPAAVGPGRRRGGGLLVNVSRGIAGAGTVQADPGPAIAAAAARWSELLEC